MEIEITTNKGPLLWNVKRIVFQRKNVEPKIMVRSRVEHCIVPRRFVDSLIKESRAKITNKVNWLGSNDVLVMDQHNGNVLLQYYI